MLGQLAIGRAAVGVSPFPMRMQTMNVTVVYSTEALLYKNNGQPGEQHTADFGSIDAAKNAVRPAGCVSALIREVNGHHVYTARFGWEFYPN